jgi:hypothetical protein
MEDTQREPRASGTNESEQTDETRAQETPVAVVARLLANPRRVRVN